MTRNPPTLRQWLAKEPFWLTMSSGFFGFYAHCGMLLALEDEGITPDGAAGSSAGALIAGLWAAGLDAASIRNRLLEIRRQDFWDPAPGAGLLRGRAFRNILEQMLPVTTFEECRAPAAMSTFDLVALRTRVLNSGALAPAIHASCAVPLLLQPVWLNGRPCFDGGVLDRSGLAGVPHDQRVLLHHLASKSPWRLSPPQVPRRPNLTALVIPDLPRTNPFALNRGHQALEHAYRATRQALALRIEQGVVTVPGGQSESAGRACI